MKKNEAFKFLIQKCLWIGGRPNRFLKEEGSWAVDPNIVEKRFKLLLKLYKEDNILPYENIIRAVDVCAFACKDVICHEKVSYRLFKNVYKNFIDQYFYDLQIAQEGLLEICKEHYLNQEEPSDFFYRYKKKVLKDPDDQQVALDRIFEFFDMPLSEPEKNLVNKFSCRHHEQLLDWGL